MQGSHLQHLCSWWISCTELIVKCRQLTNKYLHCVTDWAMDAQMDRFTHNQNYDVHALSMAICQGMVGQKHPNSVQNFRIKLWYTRNIIFIRTPPFLTAQRYRAARYVIFDGIFQARFASLPRLFWCSWAQINRSVTRCLYTWEDRREKVMLLIKPTH